MPAVSEAEVRKILPVVLPLAGATTCLSPRRTRSALTWPRPGRGSTLLVLLLLLTIWAPGVFGTQLELDAEARTYLAGGPTITIGVVADNEPYSWIEGGQLSGFSIDVLEEIAHHTGLRFNYRAGSWPELYPAFLRGEIDAIDEISFREDRAERMLFTEPYHYRRTVIMHDPARPLARADTLGDLREVRVGVVRDIYYKSDFIAHGIDVVEYDALPNLVRALAFGWVDAIAGPEVTLQFLARRAGFNHLSVAGRVDMGGLEIEDFRIAVLREDPLLHRILAAGLAAIPPSRLAQLVEVWQEFGGQAIGAAPPLRLSEQQAAYVRRLGPVRVGLMRDYAPFSFVDGGRAQGLSVDFLERVSDLTGLHVIPVTDRWPVLFELFQRGEIDVIANISYSAERTDYTRFTRPYHVIPNVAFTRNPELRVSTPEDLEGQRIALGSGIFYETWMRERFGDTVFTFSSQEAMFGALAEGSVDVVLVALPNGNHWVRELGLADVRIAGELRMGGFEGEDLRFGVRPALEPLASIMDAALGAISPTERRTIENRWLGAAAFAAEQIGRVDHDIELSAEEKAYLASRDKTVRICVDPAWMPLEGIDAGGRHTGMAADVLALFRTRLDIVFELVPTASWSESLRAAQTRGCDAFPLAMATPERLRYMDFTSPYLTVPNVALARVEAPFIDTLDELSGKRVGIVAGYAYTELLRTRHPRLRLIEVADETDGLRRLQRGELDAYISTLVTAAHHLRELGLADIKVIGRVPGDWALSLATRNDHPELLGIAQKLVDSLTDAERAQIEDKWRTVRLEERPDYTLLWQLALAAAVGLALLFAWNRKLGALNRELARANEKLARLSVTDNLTGIGNREYFEQAYPRLYRWCQREQRRFAVAMIDIDHFKLINDSFGHAAGDDCLQALSRCLRKHVRRGTDHIARLGGEEFVLFTTCSDTAEFLDHMDALREAVQALRIPVGETVITLTVSIGIASAVPLPDENADTMLEQADKALYAAKRGGRNRTVLATDGLHPAITPD